MIKKKQKEAIDELYQGDGDELAVCSKLNIKNSQWQSWLGSREFSSELEYRTAALKRQTEIMLAKYSPLAVAVLISLCKSQSDETSRKACVDILQIALNLQSRQPEASNDNRQTPEIDQETASAVLAVLAERKRQR